MKSCLYVTKMAVCAALPVLATVAQGVVGRVPGIVSLDGKVGVEFSLEEGLPDRKSVV